MQEVRINSHRENILRDSKEGLRDIIESTMRSVREDFS